tara:strand:- start:2641 stop:4719 length:2079 start_codon:yes stop_codon:yes gene_type:complete
MCSAQLMRIWIAVPIAMMLFFSSWYAYTNPELIESVIENSSDVSNDDEIVALNVQPVEKWLVLLVDFQDKPVNQVRNVDTAKSLINGENGVSNYLTEMFDGKSVINFDFHDTVLHGIYNEADYGHDANGIRDYGIGSSGGASGLAAEALSQADNQGVDWENYDLNSDGVVDRLLILHTGGVQEDGGNTNELWSHFGYLDEELNFNGSNIVTYAMAGLKSNMGTIAHEMLHSFGAADLYAVHDDLPKDNWKGVGDFDIMASGNWAENSQGESRPVLPMAATMNVMGLDRFEEINLEDIGSNGEAKFELSPMSDSGIAYRIKLSESEFLWLEFRHQSGIDVELPGSGLLVSIEDVSVGNISLNNVNRDSQNPYLLIVEADGNADLISGRDSGDSSDLFTNGTKFGNDGIQIRDKFGFLVPWLIEIDNNTDEKLEFTFNTDQLPIISVEYESNPVELLDGEEFFMDVSTTADCNFNAELFGDDSRILTFESELDVGQENLVYGTWDESPNSEEGQFFGILKCGDIPQLNVKLGWKLIGNRIATSYFEGKIHFEELRDVVIPLEFEGNGTRTYHLEYVGPLERIVSSPNEVTLAPGDDLVININPQGLLTPGMYARGQVILHDGLYEHDIEVVLQSEFIEGSSSIQRFIGGPSQLISISLALGGVWFLLSIPSSYQKFESKKEDEETLDVAEEIYY